MPLPTRRRLGRPRLEDEAGGVWRLQVEHAFAVKRANPRYRWAAIARRMNMDDGTLARYRHRYVTLYGDPNDDHMELSRLGERKDTV